jgi:hypothetical protein
MSLMIGFFALGGLLAGLTLIVVWAGSLERWMERQEVAADDLELHTQPVALKLIEAADNPAAISLPPEPTEAEPVAAPSAA